MKVTMQFRNFQLLPHLQEFIEDAASKSIGKFARDRFLEADFRLSMVTAREEAHRSPFECEINLRGPMLRRPLFVRKQGGDFYQAVRNCIHATRELVNDNAKIRVAKRRRRTRKIGNLMEQEQI